MTFNNANNYGAFCQEYALQKWLSSHGYIAQVLNLDNEQFDQKYKYNTNVFKLKSIKLKLRKSAAWILKPKTMLKRSAREKAFAECRNREINESLKYKDSELPEIVNNYKCFISGSDQVWNLQINRGHTSYFLDFVPADQSYKKLSYAASMDCDKITKDDEARIKGLLSDFASVLVREQSTCDFLDKQLDISSKVVLDPVFLIDRELWDNFADKSSLKRKTNDYLLVYIVGSADKVYKKAIEYADKKGWDVIFLGLDNPVKLNGKGYTTLIDPGPYEFVDIIRNAQEIYTTSFHAIAFSIIFEKPFIYESIPKINMSRITDLLADLDIEDRALGDSDPKMINWIQVREKLNSMRIYSEELLDESIQKALQYKE